MKEQLGLRSTNTILQWVRMDKQKALKAIDAALQNHNRQATTRELWNAWWNLLTLNMMIETESAN